MITLYQQAEKFPKTPLNCFRDDISEIAKMLGELKAAIDKSEAHLQKVKVGDAFRKYEAIKAQLKRSKNDKIQAAWDEIKSRFSVLENGKLDKMRDFCEKL